MRSSFLVLTLVVVLPACGGKIVEVVPERDPAIDTSPPAAASPPPSSSSSVVEETPPPPLVAPAANTPVDACAILCDRDARCDTTLPAIPSREGESPDCNTRCRARIAQKCGIDDWLLCYASHIDPNACTPLPEDCRPSFCAWARCAKQPVSNCE